MAGQCYRQAYTEQLNRPDVKLVHGIVNPLVGELKGKSYGHAWLETKTEVIDPSLPIGRQKYPKERYYMLGGIEYTRKYDLDQTLEQVQVEKNYGPWDDTISSAEHL